MAKRRKSTHRKTRKHHKATTPKAKITKVIQTLHAIKRQV